MKIRNDSDASQTLIDIGFRVEELKDLIKNYDMPKEVYLNKIKEFDSSIDDLMYYFCEKYNNETHKDN